LAARQRQKENLNRLKEGTQTDGHAEDAEDDRDPLQCVSTASSSAAVAPTVVPTPTSEVPRASLKPASGDCQLPPARARGAKGT
jgi:hypothetical protein